MFVAQLSREDADALQAHVGRLEREDGAAVAVQAGAVGLGYYAVAVVDCLHDVGVLLHEHLAPLCEQRLEMFWGSKADVSSGGFRPNTGGQDLPQP